MHTLKRRVITFLVVACFLLLFASYSGTMNILEFVTSRAIHHHLAFAISFVKNKLMTDEVEITSLQRQCSAYGWRKRTTPVRIFSGFTFMSEHNMLELRLAELDGVVDYFVIVETATTFSGNPKPLGYWENRAKYARWADRIIHVVVNDTSRTSGPWKRQADARSAIVLGMDQAGARADDFVVLTDADEIPRATVLRTLKECEGYPMPVTLHMPEYYYDFGCEDEHSHWTRVKMLRRDQLVESCSTGTGTINKFGQWAVCPDMTRSGDPKIVDDILHVATPGLRVRSAGWHLSFFMDFEKTVEKLGAYAHTERSMSASEGNRRYLQCLMQKCIHVNRVDHGTRRDASLVDAPRYAVDQKNLGNPHWARFFPKHASEPLGFGCAPPSD